MRCKIAVIGVIIFGILLAGCDLWMDGNYHHVTPHVQQNLNTEDDQLIVGSYGELYNAVKSLVEEGNQKRVIYTRRMEPQQVANYMQEVIHDITTNHAIGAYAVDKIEYEFGTNTGIPALALQISYRHSRSEILRIKHVKTMQEAIEVITTALDNCNAGVTLCVDAYEDMDFTQLIQDYVDATPWKCMEMPQVAEMVYPDSGQQRVIELSFAYQTSRDSLRNMQETVGTVFASAELYVHGDADSLEKYTQLYSFLMERYDYTIETSITPAYSLLRHGVGDAKAFATVYGAMCRRAGLECWVVTGTKEGEPWYWNIILVDGTYYHLDLLQCSQVTGFMPKQEFQMEGYVWDYSAYPPNSEENP